MLPFDKVTLWIFGTLFVVFGSISIRWKLTEIRENRRNWRLWVVAPFFRYQQKDAQGRWSAINFEATWVPQGFGYRLVSIHIPSPANWFTSPDWAVGHRDDIIAHLKEAYPAHVDFIDDESAGLQTQKLSQDSSKHLNAFP